MKLPNIGWKGYYDTIISWSKDVRSLIADAFMRWSPDHQAVLRESAEKNNTIADLEHRIGIIGNEKEDLEDQLKREVSAYKVLSEENQTLKEMVDVYMKETEEMFDELRSRGSFEPIIEQFKRAGVVIDLNNPGDRMRVIEKGYDGVLRTNVRLRVEAMMAEKERGGVVPKGIKEYLDRNTISLRAYDCEIKYAGYDVAELLQLEGKIERGISILNFLSESDREQLVRDVMLILGKDEEKTEHRYEFVVGDVYISRAVEIHRTKQKSRPLKLIMCPNIYLNPNGFRKKARAESLHRVSSDLSNWEESEDRMVLDCYFQKNPKRLVLDFYNANSVPEGLVRTVDSLCKIYKGDVYIINTVDKVYTSLINGEVPRDNIYFREVEVPKEKPVEGPVLVGDMMGMILKFAE